MDAGVGKLARLAWIFKNGMRTLLDLRFADDLLFFCENVSGNKIFVGRTGDLFGFVWPQSGYN